MIVYYTGTATVAVSNGTATVTNVSETTQGAFSLLVAGSIFQCNGGAGIVDSNTGTVITITGWGGAASTTAVSWKGMPPSDSATLATTALSTLQYLQNLNSLPAGRMLKTMARDTLIALDCFSGCYLWSMALTAPPTAPAVGDAYAVPGGATGAWANYVGKIACYINGSWLYLSPYNGLTAYNAADGKRYLYAGTSWQEVSVSKIGGYSVTLTGTLSINGGYSSVFRTVGTTDVTLPVSGTLASLSQSQTWTQPQTINTASASVLRLRDTNAISTFEEIASFLTPNAVAGALPYVTLGVSNSSVYNGAALTFAYTAPGSTANRLDLGLIGSNSMLCISPVGVFTGANLPLGTATSPWSGGYTQTAFVVTSGAAYKENVSEFGEAKTAVAKAIVLNCPRAYQLVASVAEKGAGKARFHYGAVYEDVYRQFVDAGWSPADIEREALFVAAPATKTVTKTRTVAKQKTETKTRDVETITVTDGVAVLTTTAETYDVPVFETVPVKDAAGNVVYDAAGGVRTYQNPVMEDVTETYTEEVVDPAATPVRGLRYTELMIWVWVGLTSLRADDLAMVDALTARVAALEAKPAA